MTVDSTATLPARDPEDDLERELRGLRVLVVDGSEESRRNLGLLLNSMGMQATLMALTQPAIDELRRASREGQPYGLLLFDPTLRGSSAFRARRAQDDPLLAVTPRLELTADASRSEAPVEPEPRLPRPATPAALRAALGRVLGRSVHSRNAPRRAPGVSPPLPSTLVLRSDPVSALLACRAVELAGRTPVVVDSLEEALAASEGADSLVLDAATPESAAHAESLRRARPALRVLRPEDLEADLGPGAGRTQPTTPAAPEAPPFDRAALVRRLGGDAEAAQQVLDRFVEGAEGYLRDLRSASDPIDADAIRKQAHRIRGSLSWIGAAQAAGVAAGIEELCRAGEHERAAESCGTLAQEIQRVAAAIRDAAGSGAA